MAFRREHKKHPSRFIDLTGQRYGKLVAVKSIEPIHRGAARWICKCDCGKEYAVDAGNMRNGNTKSCGCYKNTCSILPGDLGSFNAVYNEYTNNAKTRKLLFSLSKDEFRKLACQPCKYCGSEPKPFYAKNRRVTKAVPCLINGVDREDNSKGYEMSNCVPCCSLCNYMKRSMTVKDFVAHIQKAAAHLGSINV